MAHKKAGGSSRNGRDSNAQRLGVKAFDGQQVHGGSILVRHAFSRGVGLGRDCSAVDRRIARGAVTPQYTRTPCLQSGAGVTEP